MLLYLTECMTGDLCRCLMTFFFCNIVEQQLFGLTLIYWKGACAVSDARVPRYRFKNKHMSVCPKQSCKKQYFSNSEQRAFYMQPIKRRRRENTHPYCINGTHAKNKGVGF